MTRISGSPGAAGEAEGDAAVVGEGEAERAEHVDLLAGHQLRLDRRLGDLVGGEDERRQGAGQGPGAGGGAHPAIRLTTTTCSTNSTMIPTIGLRSSAKLLPPTEGRKRRKKLR